MGDVDAAVRGDDLAEGDQLVGPGVGVGRVDQARGDAEGAVLHRLASAARIVASSSGVASPRA